MSDSGYNYTEYKEALEKILEGATHDYWVQYVDINRHQVGVAKTYMWVAVALMGGYMAAFKLIDFESSIYPSSFITFFIIALLLVVTSFGLCLYAIPARKGYKLIAPKSWGEFSQNANSRLTKKENNIYISTLNELIDKTDSGVIHNLNTNNSRAKLLRATSWLLLGSFLVAVLASISLGAANIEFKTNKEEIVMSDESNADAGNSGADSLQGSKMPSTTDVPEVPTPKGPLVREISNIYTDSIECKPGGVISTESK